MINTNNPFVRRGLPTILFSIIGFYTLNQFISGDISVKGKSKLSISEREDRLEVEKKELFKKVEEKWKDKENSFDKRVPRGKNDI